MTPIERIQAFLDIFESNGGGDIIDFFYLDDGKGGKAELTGADLRAVMAELESAKAASNEKALIIDYCRIIRQPIIAMAIEQGRHLPQPPAARVKEGK